MSLTVACSSCGAKLRAPDNAFGKSSKCPKCGHPVTVTAITTKPATPSVEKVESTPQLAAPVSTPSPLPVPATVPTPVPIPTARPLAPVAMIVAEVAHEEHTKPCPFCGETILAVAKKCKHCGETIDVTLRAAEEARRAAERQGSRTVFMNAGGGGASSSSSSAAAAASGARYRPNPLLVRFLATILTFIFCAGFPIFVCSGIIQGCNNALDKSMNRRDEAPAVPQQEQVEDKREKPPEPKKEE